MKGRIDIQGFLGIYRGDANPKGYQAQMCPFTSCENGLIRNCGQWCPHFGEAHAILYEDYDNPEAVDGCIEGHTNLEICHGKTLIFDEFEVEE